MNLCEWSVLNVCVQFVYVSVHVVNACVNKVNAYILRFTHLVPFEHFS